MAVNITMSTAEIEQLIDQGNAFRAGNQPQKALQCYSQAFVSDPDSFSAWNNYGNVIRECGHPARGVPFIQHALTLAPDNPVANFNLAVCYLMMGDYARGWAQIGRAHV